MPLHKTLRLNLALGAILLATIQCQRFSPSNDAVATVAAPMVARENQASPTPPTPTATATLLPSATPIPTLTPSAAPSATVTARPTAIPSSTPLPHPLACAEPPQDYTRVLVDRHMLNARTLAMLRLAQQIYDGPGDIMRITQGSYRDVVEVSFGTHAGGGAVDISIRDPQNESVLLWDEAGPIVIALRYAGFAAWFRDVGDLGEGSPAHIHAIAVGDAELSEVAQEQVTGEGGYLAGMDGLIAPYGPNADRHGGPVICDWME